jgi:hypothetical protein
VNHSNTIFGALILGFMLYVTVKGELPKYLAVLGLGSK